MSKVTLGRAEGERLRAIAKLLETLDAPETADLDVRFLDELGLRAIAAAPEDGPVIHMPRLLGMTFGVSQSEARRMLATGGVRIGGRRITAIDLPRDQVDGQQLMLGLRRAAVIDLGTLEGSDPQ